MNLHFVFVDKPIKTTSQHKTYFVKISVIPGLSGFFGGILKSIVSESFRYKSFNLASRFRSNLDLLHFGIRFILNSSIFLELQSTTRRTADLVSAGQFLRVQHTHHLLHQPQQTLKRRESLFLFSSCYLLLIYQQHVDKCQEDHIILLC